MCEAAFEHLPYIRIQLLKETQRRVVINASNQGEILLEWPPLIALLSFRSFFEIRRLNFTRGRMK